MNNCLLFVFSHVFCRFFSSWRWRSAMRSDREVYENETDTHTHTHRFAQNVRWWHKCNALLNRLCHIVIAKRLIHLSLFLITVFHVLWPLNVHSIEIVHCLVVGLKWIRAYFCMFVYLNDIHSHTLTHIHGANVQTHKCLACTCI